MLQYTIHTMLHMLRFFASCCTIVYESRLPDFETLAVFVERDVLRHRGQP